MTCLLIFDALAEMPTQEQGHDLAPDSNLLVDCLPQWLHWRGASFADTGHAAKNQWVYLHPSKLGVGACQLTEFTLDDLAELMGKPRYQQVKQIWLLTSKNKDQCLLKFDQCLAQPTLQSRFNQRPEIQVFTHHEFCSGSHLLAQHLHDQLTEKQRMPEAAGLFNIANQQPFERLTTRLHYMANNMQYYILASPNAPCVSPPSWVADIEQTGLERAWQWVRPSHRLWVGDKNNWQCQASHSRPRAMQKLCSQVLNDLQQQPPTIKRIAISLAGPTDIHLAQTPELQPLFAYCQQQGLELYISSMSLAGVMNFGIDSLSLSYVR